MQIQADLRGTVSLGPDHGNKVNMVINQVTQILRFPSTCVCVRSVVQSCPTLQPHGPGCSVHGISQARVLEWAAIPFSSSQCI